MWNANVIEGRWLKSSTQLPAASQRRFMIRPEPSRAELYLTSSDNLSRYTVPGPEERVFFLVPAPLSASDDTLPSR